MRSFPILRLILLALLLTVLTVPALAEPCVRCGDEAGKDEYLCTACLIGLLEGDPDSEPLAITRIYRDYWGNVLVQWTDAQNNGPYCVRYELQESAPNLFGWTAGENVSERFLTITRLTPGVCYIITVTDAQGNVAKAPYCAAVPAMDQEIGARFYLEPQQHTADGRFHVAPFSLAEMQSDSSAHSLSVTVSYSALARDRLYNFDLAVEAPNGYADVVYSGRVALGPGRTYLPEWSRIPLDTYFANLERYYGGVPLGDYTVTLYFNGNAAHTETFAVVE